MDLSLQCRICSNRSERPWIALTESISRGDLLVTLAPEQLEGTQPTVGDPLVVEIDLPANHNFGRKCMQCQVTVARVTTDPSGWLHLMLRIHKIRFEECEREGLYTPASADSPNSALM